jgi:hypothetical protein
MVIVSVRRRDLRHEISMPDEAFALSPINARPSLPTEADYDAIQEAFMETARGRWFLGEYAKRNRNADTRMVLDAVERIEATIAGHRQAQAEVENRAKTETDARAAGARAETQVNLWPELSRAFTKARTEIALQLMCERNEAAFEAIRTSTETIKSVLWALRERGFETRVCDFLDTQVNAITDGCTGLMAESSLAVETEAKVLAAFDAMIEQVEALAGIGDGGTEALDAVVDAVADAMSEAHLADEGDEAGTRSSDDAAITFAAPTPARAPTATHQIAPAEIPSVEIDPDAAFREIYGDDADTEIADASLAEEPAPAVLTEPEINKQRLYEAKLASYRPANDTMHAPAQAIDAASGIDIVDVAGTEDKRAPPAQERMQAAIMGAAPADQPLEKPTSLGQVLIASGMVRAASDRPDPLAPFRRMSQADKIALFT